MIFNLYSTFLYFWNVFFSCFMSSRNERTENISSNDFEDANILMNFWGHIRNCHVSCSLSSNFFQARSGRFHLSQGALVCMANYQIQFYCIWNRFLLLFNECFSKIQDGGWVHKQYTWNQITYMSLQSFVKEWLYNHKIYDNDSYSEPKQLLYFEQKTK